MNAKSILVVITVIKLHCCVVRFRAKRISRAPTYSMLSSPLRWIEVKLKTPSTEKLLVVLSFASEQEQTEERKRV